MRDFLALYKIPLLLAVLSITMYFSFAYDLERSDFTKLISLYAALFFLYYKIIKSTKGSFWFLAALGIVFRLVFFAAIPNLSQDFYRFIWDGNLVLDGLNPYLFSPNEIITNPSFIFRNATENTIGVGIANAETLVQGMGNLSAGNFSNYPPVNQLFFALAVFLGGKGILGPVIAMRAFTIVADIGILYFGKKILEKLGMNPLNIFWYFLNPFIIIELTGNLHFEAIMLFFLIWALYTLLSGKWLWAAVLMGVSISVKLIPLTFLPLFINFFYKKDLSTALKVTSLFKFYTITIFTVFITFSPFISSEFIQNFSSTIALWFQKFEFNASVYYIIRWVGFQIKGWNIIESVGKVLPVIVLLFVLAIAFFRNNKNLKSLLTAMLFAVSFYFLLSTTVHPWYVATPLLLSIFTKYRFPLLWSLTIMLSYAAYTTSGFQENMWLITLEYTVVISYAILEIFFPKKKTQLFLV